MTDVLPAGFDDQIVGAIRFFWLNRSSGSDGQEGSRGNVIGGKNMDGFLALVRNVALHCGLPASAVYTQGKTDLTLPGYYRPVKNWDAVIVHQGRFLAALEFKSQVGSFGNNFNNRAEEAIGNASDLWAAWQNGAFHPERHRRNPAQAHNPRRPFVGYLMLLEDCPGSTRPIKAEAGQYPVFPEFEDTSYAERYRFLCERLIEQGLYQVAALALSPADRGRSEGLNRALTPATSVRELFSDLAWRLMQPG